MKAAPPHSPATRERLLETAERLFAERGFAGTSVREITDAAAANLGAVNYHFQSKEKLYAAVFARRAALLREPMAAVARQAEDVARLLPEAALLALGRVFLEPHSRRETSLRLLGLLTRETVENCLPSGFLAREFRAPAVEAFARVVRRMRPGIPRAVALACAHSFFAQLIYIVRGAARGAGAVGSVDEQLRHAVRFTAAAIRHIEGAPRARSQKQS